MSHHRSIAQRIVAVIFSTLLCAAAAGTAQESPNKPAKSSPARSQSSSKDQSTTDSGRPADKAKDDTGVDIDAKLKAREKKKEERKPNFEIKSVRTSPSDAITYFKPNHWTLFHLELVANNGDETVELRTSTPESLLEAMDTPHAVQYRRIVHLLKEQSKIARMPLFLPEARKGGKSVELALYHPDGVLPIQPPGIDRQPCTVLDPDQFLILALSADPDNYRFLNNMQCIEPGIEALDDEPRDKRRYFALVTQLQPTKPLVADTVLGWTTTAYVIWDDLDPGLLSSRQQEALIDWLHLGGQLIISGGSAATRLDQSFLAPYLPADVVGSAQITDLSKLSSNYLTARTIEKQTAAPKPIPILPSKPVYFAKLAPRPESDKVEDADLIGDLPLAVERRVGRGRIVMAAFSLYQPDLVLNWREGYDTFWCNRLLKIDETIPNAAFQIGGNVARTYVRLPARKLSRFRLLARDFGAGPYRPRPVAGEQPNPGGDILGATMFSPLDPREVVEKESVAEWRDKTFVPAAARQTLLDATGIKIPPPDFVLAAAISYLVVLVPLNWLICRFALRRPELAWLSAPVIILAFSVGIVRFARVNVGYDSSSHEIDVVEMSAGYPRAHVTRFTCIYSGSRGRYQLRYDDAAAIALPMSIGDVQRGKNVERVHLDWDMTDGFPVTLGRYEVNPRSVGMLRAEEMKLLGGPIRRVPGENPGTWSLDNQTGWELWDCHLVTPTETIRLGDVKPGEHLQYPPVPAAALPSPDDADDQAEIHRVAASGAAPGHSTIRELGDLSPVRLMELLEDRSPDAGTRLVAWAPKTVPGQQLNPKPDRAIGFTIFVVHLNEP